jgi:transcriptional regulator with XRE-family HTH domain
VIEPESFAKVQRRLRATLGRNVRKLRLSLGMTQSDLADRAEIRPALISDIERGETNASEILINVHWSSAWLPSANNSPESLLPLSLYNTLESLIANNRAAAGAPERGYGHPSWVKLRREGFTEEP